MSDQRKHLGEAWRSALSGYDTAPDDLVDEWAVTEQEAWEAWTDYAHDAGECYLYPCPHPAAAGSTYCEGHQG